MALTEIGKANEGTCCVLADLLLRATDLPNYSHYVHRDGRESLQRLRNLSEVPQSQDLNPNYLPPSPVPPAHAPIPSTVYQGLRQKASSCDLSVTSHPLL